MKLRGWGGHTWDLTTNHLPLVSERKPTAYIPSPLSNYSSGEKEMNVQSFLCLTLQRPWKCLLLRICKSLFRSGLCPGILQSAYLALQGWHVMPQPPINSHVSYCKENKYTGLKFCMQLWSYLRSNDCLCQFKAKNLHSIKEKEKISVHILVVSEHSSSYTCFQVLKQFANSKNHVCVYIYLHIYICVLFIYVYYTHIYVHTHITYIKIFSPLQGL